MMFMLNAPAQRMATALAALPRNLAVTVSEAVKANKFAADGAAASAGDARLAARKQKRRRKQPAEVLEANN